MRIALISDIHANREALEACLAHAARAGVDRYVFLGDYVGYGADPEWVLDTVMEHVARGAVAVLGNHDAAAIGSSEGMNAQATEAIDWTRGRLSAAHRDFLAKLPLTVEQGAVVYVHANPVAPAGWDYVSDLFSASRCLIGTSAHVTFCGHTHLPSLFHMSATGKFASFDPVDRVEIPLTTRRRWLAVIGSVGQPRDDNPAACYALLDDSTFVLTYVRVPYDIDTAAGKIRDAGLPLALAYRLYKGR
ncbi:Putative phosphoesterase [Rhodovulum sp. PH10]|uniref:metallophosphoesterase family protein n=1 Tax=Rhodovulum sp. PH10 TaxID=1187851 RepID=UPI00027C2169|nr:metallophosphoesterase family protein [Rhodovulum sp. PH10]EJW13154.1 Putative phosphoesterase [Rhodovulum sp. PH10]